MTNVVEILKQADKMVKVTSEISENILKEIIKEFRLSVNIEDGKSYVIAGGIQVPLEEFISIILTGVHNTILKTSQYIEEDKMQDLNQKMC